MLMFLWFNLVNEQLMILRNECKRVSILVTLHQNHFDQGYVVKYSMTNKVTVKTEKSVSVTKYMYNTPKLSCFRVSGESIPDSKMCQVQTIAWENL